MNMELKRRGELIESLKSDIAVKKSEENLAAQSQAEVTELRAKVEELKKELSDTKKHLEKKSMTTTTTTAVQDDAQSETMSTSTVSRVEEQSRMADIEASFEDRSDRWFYQKIPCYATYTYHRPRKCLGLSFINTFPLGTAS